MPSTTSRGSGSVADGIDAVARSLLTGLAILLPLLVTVYVLELVIGALLSGIAPWLRFAVGFWPGVTPTPLVIDGLAIALVIGIATALGFVVRFQTGETVIRRADSALRRVPGVGTLYGSVSQVADAVLTGEDHSFEDVKLVEVPSVGHYMLGFVIAESPTAVQESMGEDMETLFVPLAPNPVMAGFVIHANADELRDVDMTVEEGVSAIVSLGATEETLSQSARVGYRADSGLS